MIIQAERAENDREDIKAILNSTEVKLKSLRKIAQSQNTYGVLVELFVRS